MTTADLMAKAARIRELEQDQKIDRWRRTREIAKLGKELATALDGQQFTITIGPAFGLD